MNIFSLTSVNSFTLKFSKKKNENYEENGKIFTNKIYFIFDFTYDIQFIFIRFGLQIKIQWFPIEKKIS